MTQFAESSPEADVHTSNKAPFSVAEREARMLRGEVIDHFARIERAITRILVHVAALPAYEGLRPQFPHLMGQKIERLRKLMSTPGPLEPGATTIVPLIDKLKLFEDLRHLMAHATVEVALKQSGDPIYIFSMINTRSNDSAETKLILTKQEAQSRSARLANIAESLSSKLEAILKQAE